MGHGPRAEWGRWRRHSPSSIYARSERRYATVHQETKATRIGPATSIENRDYQADRHATPRPRVSSSTSERYKCESVCRSCSFKCPVPRIVGSSGKSRLFVVTSFGSKRSRQDTMGNVTGTKVSLLATLMVLCAIVVILMPGTTHARPSPLLR